MRRAQAGSQSPAQPASDWSEPAIVTEVGFGVLDAVAAGSSTSAAAASASERATKPCRLPSRRRAYDAAARPAMRACGRAETPKRNWSDSGLQERGIRCGDGLPALRVDELAVVLERAVALLRVTRRGRPRRLVQHLAERVLDVLLRHEVARQRAEARVRDGHADGRRVLARVAVLVADLRVATASVPVVDVGARRRAARPEAAVAAPAVERVGEAGRRVGGDGSVAPESESVNEKPAKTDDGSR